MRVTTIVLIVFTCMTFSKLSTICQPNPSIQCFNGTYQEIQHILASKPMLENKMGRIQKKQEKKGLGSDLVNAKELQEFLHGRTLYHWPFKLQQVEDNCHLHLFAFWKTPNYKYCNNLRTCIATNTILTFLWMEVISQE